MSKLAAAATCSTDCSALPPGSGQSAWTVGSGRKKSAPFSASACSTFWSKAMTEIRCPWVARVLLASFLSKGLSLEIVEQPGHRHRGGHHRGEKQIALGRHGAAAHWAVLGAHVGLRAGRKRERGGRRQGHGGLDHGRQILGGAGIDHGHGAAGPLADFVGGVVERAGQHQEVAARAGQVAGPQLGEGQRFLRLHAIGTLLAHQRGQPRLDVLVRSRVEERQGGIEAGQVGQHRIGRKLGRLVEIGHRFGGFVLLQADAAHLQQGQRLVGGRAGLGDRLERREGRDRARLLGGGQGRLIGFGGLVGLVLLVAGPAHPAAGAQNRHRGQRAHPGQRLQREGLVAVGAQLLFDLVKHIDHERGSDRGETAP
jgi:hypothetical protein